MKPTVCYVASYDPEYSRNTDTIRAFEAAGLRVEQVRGPALRDSGDLSLPRLFRNAVALVVGTLPRAIDVSLRLLRCQALVLGYMGHIDVLLLGPIAKALKRPVIFNPLVTLTDTVVEDRGIVSEQSLAASLVRRLDWSAFRLADLVLVDTHENAAYAAKLTGVDSKRFAVLPVGVDERIFFPGDQVDQEASATIDVLFYGKFIPLHGVETIVRASALLEETRHEIQLELIGTGQDYTATRKLARELGTTNIRWTDWLPYSELGGRLRAADVALGIFNGGGKAARVIPNKVHQALACGVPVVTRRSPAIERLLVDRESALLVPPDEPEALAEAIVVLASDAAMRRQIGAAGRDAWEHYASERKLIGHAHDALRTAGVIS